ncbi:MAG TPA: hypothetical protein GX505_09550 [Clostridiales bacterium]|nr:hypothetical protein [Clostridiales bacterium]
MKYLDDWDKRKERHSAFWNCELVDRCLCSVTALRDGGKFCGFPLPDNEPERRRWWTDGDLILERNLSWFANTYYGGDSLPILIHDLGPAGHAGYFKNVRIRFENTIWFDSDLEDYDDLSFDPDSFLYQKTISLAKQYAEAAQGDFIVSMPDAVGDLDVLSHLRGPENLLMDMLERPDEVKKGLRKVQEIWEKVYTEIYDIVLANNDNGSSVGWLGTWAPGRLGQLQCDLSVMISPKLFDDMVLYELETQSQWLDYALYHLDGEEQIKHLDCILSVKGINAIQWTNVAGQPGPIHYIPVLKKIQKAGKGLILHVTPDEIPLIMENLSSKGLYLLTWTNTQDEADALVKTIEKLTHD